MADDKDKKREVNDVVPYRPRIVKLLIGSIVFVIIAVFMVLFYKGIRWATETDAKEQRKTSRVSHMDKGRYLLTEGDLSEEWSDPIPADYGYDMDPRPIEKGTKIQVRINGEDDTIFEVDWKGARYRDGNRFYGYVTEQPAQYIEVRAPDEANAGKPYAVFNVIKK